LRRFTGYLSVLVFCSLLICCIQPVCSRPRYDIRPDGKLLIRTIGLWDTPQAGLNPSDPIVKLMHDDPSIRVKQWSGLTIPGAGARTPLMLSMAGDDPPELILSYFGGIRNDIKQGFLYPLNEWIGEDTNHNGKIDDNEAKWPGWKSIQPLYKNVATVNGKVYGIPVLTEYMGIVFRVDLVKKAGLDPDKPPKTWDDFFYWCQKLTDPKHKIRGFGLTPFSYTFVLWAAAGGMDVGAIAQFRTSPKTGKIYKFKMDEQQFIAPDTGEDLSRVEPVWKCTVGSEATVRTVAFYHKLRWQRWIKDPKTGEPINMTRDQAKEGIIKNASGHIVRFKPEDVIVGVAQTAAMPGDTKGDWQAIADGEIAMAVAIVNNDAWWQQIGVSIDPELMSSFPIPAGPGGRQVVRSETYYGSMAHTMSRWTKPDRDKAWKVLTAFGSTAFRDQAIRNLVLSGRARFCNPKDLRRLGMSEYVNDVPQSVREMFEDMDKGKIITKTSPFVGHGEPLADMLQREVLSLVISQSGEDFKYAPALKEVERAANDGLMFGKSSVDIAKYRPIAWLIFTIVACIFGFFVALIVKANLQAPVKTVARAGVHSKALPWIMMGPALVLIAMWGYYPLSRGLTMAFQNYRIVGISNWTGMDNFIGIFLNPDFYLYIMKTLKYVFLSLTLVFTTPIILSLLLAEIPKGKIFWRSVFFLPQLTSGLVIALLWKQVYQPGENGLLNQALSMVGMVARDWLGDVNTAMVATIIPTVWAGMGISSLIYLAALKGIPVDLYEAADLDGAGIWAKLMKITIPQLAPLIIINFVGAFIGTFQSMGNIFLLTFGGPGKETMVLGMAIWIEAYNNLRFSVATSMAWVMGSALIGFAYLQIKILSKVEFRRVEEV